MITVQAKDSAGEPDDGWRHRHASRVATSGRLDCHGQQQRLIHRDQLSDTTPQTHVISATINRVAITTPRLRSYSSPAAVSAAKSTVTSAPSDGRHVDVATSAITVTSKDQYDNVRAAGGDPIARVGADRGCARRHSRTIGDGTYTANLD